MCVTDYTLSVSFSDTHIHGLCCESGSGEEEVTGRWVCGEEVSLKGRYLM